LHLFHFFLYLDGHSFTSLFLLYGQRVSLVIT
jgi:hypothetical protein